jgi:hypothetical protein
MVVQPVSWKYFWIIIVLDRSQCVNEVQIVQCRPCEAGPDAVGALGQSL